MKYDFLGFFTKNKKRKNKKTDIVRQIENIQFKIISDTIQLSPVEADTIIKIICDELKEVTNQTGNIIAQRICEEVNSKKICTATVNGGTNGMKWLIKLSSNPLEFID